ncbi:uracil-DNA glycosylase [Verticiella sediminum]|uniref:Uracil-DNA glycosylase n=1 Tax=Verticiella sediminum TaxID=1247510 RepID=A0A556AJA0_9BURK|nr:uracil-DNA glycosylase [Verticiella sediminum]TSH92967.1 uracil-DNA glycosylase [Verticiella sediminum]
MTGVATPINRLREPLETHVGWLPPAWLPFLQDVLASPGFAELSRFIDERLAAGAIIYPAHPFRALELTAPQDVRVVILGQDPYHGPGQAQGLCFSVPDRERRPPSLRNIFAEVANTCGGDPATFSNDLTRWGHQGVLLLNTLLTVEDGKPASHAKRGWEPFTDSVIAAVANEPTPKVFMLWGSHAQSKTALIPAGSPHLVLKANHPSPLSATRPPVPFIGCGHFARANEWLAEQGLPTIDWVDPAA